MILPYVLRVDEPIEVRVWDSDHMTPADMLMETLPSGSYFFLSRKVYKRDIYVAVGHLSKNPGNMYEYLGEYYLTDQQIVGMENLTNV